jgi:MFS family permease
VAPAGAKSTWLAVFFMCIPSGIALGYVTGGVLFSLTGSWRVPFVVEALLMARTPRPPRRPPPHPLCEAEVSGCEWSEYQRLERNWRCAS